MPKRSIGIGSWVKCVWLSIGLVSLNSNPNPQQVAVLSDYDFSESGYVLIFHLPVGSTNNYVLYAQREEQLEAYKKAWVFEKEAFTYPFACNDGYNIELQKNHQSLEFFGVRFRCKAFIARGEYWDLPSEVSLGHLSLDTAKVTLLQYENLEAARAGLTVLKESRSIIGVSHPEWESNDGYFHFRYPNPGLPPKSPAIDWGGLTLEVKDQIQQKFPNEDFDLELTYYGYGKNYPEVGFKLSGKKSLFSAFNLYPKSERGWIDFEPKLTVYSVY